MNIAKYEDCKKQIDATNQGITGTDMLNKLSRNSLDSYEQL